MSLRFVPQGPINNFTALVQIMAWRRPGDKPFSGPMMVSLLTHICVSRPQWVNNNVTKDRCAIPMDTTVRLGSLKFSLRVTIDHHGPSIHSGHYTTSINFCKKTLYCNDNTITCHGSDQTPILLFESTNHVSIHSYSITYAVEEFLLSIIPNSLIVWSFLYFDICNYICLDTSNHLWALSFLNIVLYFFKYSSTKVVHGRSRYICY